MNKYIKITKVQSKQRFKIRMTLLGQNCTNNCTHQYVGIFPEIFYLLQEELNFKSKINYHNGVFGSLEKDNITWSGMVGQMQRKAEDCIVQGVTPTAQRSTVINNNLIFGMIINLFEVLNFSQKYIFF